MSSSNHFSSPKPLPSCAPDNGLETALDRGESSASKQAERAWHEAHYSKYALHAYPETAEEFQRRFARIVLTDFCEGGWNWWADAQREAVEAAGNVRGLRVLDYGCGYGRLGVYLGLRGAQVWGFDLSSAAVETANQGARRYGLASQFAQMDAESLTYADDFFDLVTGFGVLHHVIKYPGAGSELLRVLKPGARAIFHETLWNNFFINLARRFTTEDSEAGDAHLTEEALRGFCHDFRRVRLEKRHLFYMLKRLAKPPLHNLDAALQPRPLWRRLKAVDDWILRCAPLRRYCGEVIVYLEK